MQLSSGLIIKNIVSIGCMNFDKFLNLCKEFIGLGPLSCSFQPWFHWWDVNNHRSNWQILLKAQTFLHFPSNLMTPNQTGGNLLFFLPTPWNVLHISPNVIRFTLISFLQRIFSVNYRTMMIEIQWCYKF